MQNPLGSPANTDVIIVGTQEEPAVKIINPKDLEKAGKIANNHAEFVLQETITPLTVTQNPKDEPNTVRIEGRMSINKEDCNAPGTIAATMVVGLVRAKEMDMTQGVNALRRFLSQGHITQDMLTKDLKAIGYQPPLGRSEVPETGLAPHTR